MATNVNNKCKAFTSMEQSKRLAEILPLESADMFYVAGKGEPIFIGNKMVSCGNDDYDALGGPDVLCWSLAALLDILKDKITFGGASNKDWFVAYIAKTPRKLLTIYKSNLVDACVDVIEKLYKLKML